MSDIPLSCFQTPQPSQKARAGSSGEKAQLFSAQDLAILKIIDYTFADNLELWESSFARLLKRGATLFYCPKTVKRLISIVRGRE